MCRLKKKKWRKKRLHQLLKNAARSHFLRRTDGCTSLPFKNIFREVSTILQPRGNTEFRVVRREGFFLATSIDLDAGRSCRVQSWGPCCPAGSCRPHPVGSESPRTAPSSPPSSSPLSPLPEIHQKQSNESCTCYEVLHWISAPHWFHQFQQRIHDSQVTVTLSQTSSLPENHVHTKTQCLMLNGKLQFSWIKKKKRKKVTADIPNQDRNTQKVTNEHPFCPHHD